MTTSAAIASRMMETHAIRIAVVVLFMELVLHVFSKSLALGSARMIKKLRTEIAEIRKEAAPLNNPSTFAKHAKLERQAAAKEKEMEKLKAEWESPKHKMMQKIPLLTRLAVWTWVLYIQGKVPVIQLGKKAAWPIGPLLSFPYGGDWMGGGAVSCVFWLSLCHKFSSMLVRAALPQ